MKIINVLGVIGIALFFGTLFTLVVNASGLKTALIVFIGGFAGAAFLMACLAAATKQ